MKLNAIASIISILIVSSLSTAVTAAPKPSQPSGTAKPMSCINIKNSRWQLCGSFSRKHAVGGVGVRFNRVDPNGRITASKSYDNCHQLTQDSSLPLALRTEAARQCR